MTTKLPNLKWKTWPKQPLGYLPLAFALPVWFYLIHKRTSLLQIGINNANEPFMVLAPWYKLEQDTFIAQAQCIH
jgi:hypothetical protein